MKKIGLVLLSLGLAFLLILITIPKTLDKDNLVQERDYTYEKLSVAPNKFGLFSSYTGNRIITGNTFLFSSSATSISGWLMTNRDDNGNQNTNIRTSVDSTYTSFRRIQNTNGTLTGYYISKENTGDGVTFISNHGVNNQDVNKQLSIYRSVTGLTANRTYIMRIEFTISGPANTIFRVEATNNGQIFNQAFGGASGNYANTKEFVSPGTSINLDIRIYGTNNSNQRLTLKNIILFEKDSYTLQNNLFAMYDTEVGGDLSFKSIDELDQSIETLQSSISAYTAGSDTYRTDVLNGANQLLNDIVGKRDELKTLYTTLDSLYSGSPKFIKLEVTQQDIDNLLNEINTLTSNAYKNDLLSKISTLQEDYNLKESKLSAVEALETQITEYKNHLDILPLTPEQKQTIVDELDSYKESKTTEINESTSISNVETLISESTNHLKEDKLAKTKDSINQSIDSENSQTILEIEDIQILTESELLLYKENLNSKYNVIKDTVASSSTTEQVLTAYNQYLNDLEQTLDMARQVGLENLNHNKQDIKDELQSIHDQTIVEGIESLNNLSDQQKESYLQDASLILNDAFTTIDNAERNTELLDTKTQTITALANLLNAARLEDHKISTSNHVSQSVDALKDQINEMKHLTEFEKTTLLIQITDLQDTTNQSINAQSSITDVDTVFNSFETNLNSILLNAYRQDTKSSLDKTLNELITKVEGYQHITDTEKQNKINELTTIVNNSKTQIDQLSTTEAIDDRINKTQQDLNSIIDFLDYKEQVIQELIDSIVSNPTQEVIDKLNEAISELQDTTTTQELENLKEQYDKELSDLQLEEYKNQGINELENFAVQPRSEDIQDLIDDVKNKINESTTSSDINDLVNEYKDKILNQKKDEVENELESYVPEPRSEAIEHLLDEAQSAIENATTPEVLNDVLDQYKDSLLQQSQEEAKTKIDTYLQKPYSSSVSNMIDGAHININNSTNPSDLKSFIDQTLNELLDQYKNELITSIESQKNESTSNEVNELVDQARDEIQNATSPSESKEKYDGFINLITEQKALENHKENSIDELENFAVQPRSEAVQDLIDDVKNKINESTTSSEINDLVNEYKDKILNQKKDEVGNELESYVPEPRSEAIEHLLDEAQSAIENATTPEVLNDVLDQYKDFLLEQLKNESKVLIESYIPRPHSSVIEDIIRSGSLNIDASTNPTDLFTTLSQTTNQLTENFKDELTQSIVSQKDSTTSSKVNEFVDQATELIELSTTPSSAKEIYDEYLNKISNQKILDNALKAFEEYYNMQMNAFNFSTLQTQNLETLYNELKDKLRNSEISLEDAKRILLDRIKDFKELIYEVVNGHFNLLDDNLEYPQNSGNNVYAGVVNADGLRIGTTLDIIKDDVSESEMTTIYEKLDHGTLNIPLDTLLTKDNIKEKLLMMNFLRKIDVSLFYQDGTQITEYYGIYKLSLLIPTEFRDTQEFLVIFETEDGINVQKTYRSNAWLTFETTHFSSFYILGLKPTNESNQITENLILLILIGLNLLMAILIGLAYMSKKSQQLNSTVLPILFIFGLSYNYFMIILLSILLFLLTIYFLYLLLSKKTVVYVQTMNQPTEKEVINLDTQNQMIETMDDDLDEESDTEILMDIPSGTKTIIRHNYSLKARMHQAPEESQLRYSNITNLLLSYEKVKVRTSWRYDRFMIGRKTLLKLAIYTNTVKIFFADNPKDYLDREYNMEIMTDKKVHEATPYYVKITGPRLEDYMMRIIKMMLKDEKIKESFKPINYTLPYKDKKTLIDMKLIKVVKTEQQINL